MFIVGSDGRRDVRVCEDRKSAIGLWRDLRTLDVQSRTKPNFLGGFSVRFQELRSSMFADHPFTESRILLPYISTILYEVSREGDVCDENPR